jgi:glucose-1-phosphate cytidylyltransferase
LKVVLFCGGLGMRLYPLTEFTPKPLVTIGKEPILYQLMKYYAYFGHKDFILCLGYRGDTIKNYFSDLFSDTDENDSRNSASPLGDQHRKLIRDNVKDWNIRFVDTGLETNVGQRLKAVQSYLEKEEYFLANYSDAVTNLYLPDLIDYFTKLNKIACMITVKPFHSCHAIATLSNGLVSEITPLENLKLRINGGFFVFKTKIFDFIQPGEDLMEEPFKRLALQKELAAYHYDGFWGNMDTYKDKQKLDNLASNGIAPWQIWLS